MDFFEKHGIRYPDLHVVLGSVFADDLSDTALGWKRIGACSFKEIPGLVPPTVDGHAGRFVLFQHQPTQKTVLLQQGRLHGYEGHEPSQVVAPVLWTRERGTTRYLITNAAGSMHRDWSVGSVMLIQDHVNLTGKNPLVGENPRWSSGGERGTRFPDLSEAYSKNLTKLLKKNLEAEKIEVHEGTYLGLLGPSFETPAEIRLFAKWDLDAVGMSTVWETIALCHTRAEVVGLSLLSNLASGLASQPLDHTSILKSTASVGPRILNAVLKFGAGLE